MTWKAYSVMSGVGVLSMWFAASLPSPLPGSVPPPQPREAAAAAAAASEIEEQANRLQARLQQEALYREPGRNLFRFVPKRAPQAASSAAAAIPALPAFEPAAPAPLPMRLAGIAADQDGTVIVRTAILSTFSGVILARAGDEVLGRFRVKAVEEDAVELVTLADGTEITLTLAKSKFPLPAPE